MHYLFRIVFGEVPFCHCFFKVAFEYLIRKAKEDQGRLEHDGRLVCVPGQNIRSLKIRTSNNGH
jgi:hypothetical protein